MRFHIWTYCRHIGLSVLAALLVTGMPGEGRALGSAGVSEGEAFGEADISDAYVVLPLCFMYTGKDCDPGFDNLIECANDAGQRCSINCRTVGDPKGNYGRWSEPRLCGMRFW